MTKPDFKHFFQEGIEHFNARRFWEAHEAWEALWHAAGRHGPTADFLKGLIKLGWAIRIRRPVRGSRRKSAGCCRTR